MRRIAMASVILSVSGCALVFQDKPEKTYAAGTQPQCGDSSGWAILDVIFAAGNVASVAIVASDETMNDEDKGAQVLGGLIGAVIHLASAGAGAGWASDCREAKAKFIAEESQDARDSALRLEKRRADRERDRDEAPVAAPVVVAPVVPPPAPRGFYCSAGATTGFCVRDKAECARTRSIAIGNVPDLSECTLTESAWCAGDVCTPTQDGCAAGSDCERRE